MYFNSDTRKRNIYLLMFMIVVCSLALALPVLADGQIVGTVAYDTDASGRQTNYKLSVISATYLPAGTKIEVQFPSGYTLSANDDFSKISLSGNSADGSVVVVHPDRSADKITINVNTVPNIYLNKAFQDKFDISIPTGVFNPINAGVYTIYVNISNNAGLICTNACTMTITARKVIDRLHALDTALDRMAGLPPVDLDFSLNMVEKEINILWNDSDPILSVDEKALLETNGITSGNLQTIIDALKNYLDQIGNSDGSLDVVEWENLLEWIQPYNAANSTFRNYTELENLYNAIDNSVPEIMVERLHAQGMDVNDLIDLILSLSELNVRLGVSATEAIQEQVHEDLSQNAPIALQYMINNGLTWDNYAEVVSRLSTKEKSKIEKVFYDVNKTDSVRPYADPEPESEPFKGSQNVTFTNDIASAQIYYSVGSDSDPILDGIAYEAPVNVTSSSTLKAVSVINNVYSRVVAYNYVIGSIPVTTITLDQHELKLTVGDPARSINVTIAPSNATDKKVKLENSDSSVASAEYNTTNGVLTVTPIKEGSTTIDVISKDGPSDSCVVSVYAPVVPVGTLTVPETMELTVGEGDGDLKATITPDTATEKGVTWSLRSGDESVVSLTYTNETATLSPIKAGIALVTVTSLDGQHFDTCTVTVHPAIVTVTAVSIDNKKNQTIKEDDQPLNLTATVSPPNATDKTQKWSSSDTSVVSVYYNEAKQQVEITPKSIGTATVTVETANGEYNDSCEVTVVAKTVHVTGITLNQKTLILQENGSIGSLIAEVLPSNADNKFVTWQSSNPSVASVETGVYNNAITVRPYAYGTADITATTADGKKSATCAVTVEKQSQYRLELTTNKLQYYYNVDAVAVTASVYVNDISVNSGVYVSLELKNAAGSIATEQLATDINGTVTWSISKAQFKSIGEYTVIGSIYYDTTLTSFTLIDKPPSEIAVESVSLQPTLTMNVGDSPVLLTALIVPSDATDKTVTWATTDKNIAKVDAGSTMGTAYVTPIFKGTATVTVKTSNGKTGTCLITVNDKPQPVYSVKVKTDSVDYFLGRDKVTVSATVYADGNPVGDAIGVSLELDLGTEMIAVEQKTTNASGNVEWVIDYKQFEKIGTYTIHAALLDKTDTATFNVKGIPVAGVSLLPISLKLTENGATGTLVTTLAPDNAYNKTINWSSDKETIAKVSGGIVTPLSPGVAIITATTADGSFKAYCTVTVEAAEIAINVSATIQGGGNNLSTLVVEAYNGSIASANLVETATVSAGKAKFKKLTAGQNYIFVADADKALSKSAGDKILSANMTLDYGQLYVGDTNGDDKCSSADLANVLLDYDKVSSTIPSPSRSDVNMSGGAQPASAGDLSLILLSYDKNGSKAQ